MRIWDINPGYLNRQSLLGEHRELHGLVSILLHHKQGYSRHPETLRWVGYEWALWKRHQLLAAEMQLRGFCDRTPLVELVNTTGGQRQWPPVYIDTPLQQFERLRLKYKDKQPGRLALPYNAQHLWSQHKYSVMARDYNQYKHLGPCVAQIKSATDFAELATLLTEILRCPPSTGGLKTTLQHLWGYVSSADALPQGTLESWTLAQLFQEIQHRARKNNTTYLMASTALSELKTWIPENATLQTTAFSI